MVRCDLCDARDLGRRKRAGAFISQISGSTPGRSDFSKRRFLTPGRCGSVALMAARAGADTLIFSAGFRDWCFNLAGTVSSGGGAQVSDQTSQFSDSLFG